MDPVSLAVGAVVFGVGGVVGRMGRSKTPKSPELICSCTHGYGMHEAGRRCHGTTSERDYLRDIYTVQCGCHLYDGPEPLPRTWTVETPDRGGVATGPGKTP